MGRVCIFCREEKNNFNREHMFPEAIGGSYKLSNVCKNCNNILGKGVDRNFTKERLILLYRKVYNIGRGKRDIKNPLKGLETITSENSDDKYQCYFNTDNNLEVDIVPKYEEPKPGLDGKVMGTLTIPLKQFKDEKDARERYARKFGLDPETIQILKREIGPKKMVRIEIFPSYQVLMLGILKIAYEYAMTFIPNYSNDPRSNTFAQMLLSNSFPKEHEPFFQTDDEVSKLFTRQIKDIKAQTIHHMAMLISIKGRGLFCAVRIFSCIGMVKLSEKDDYLRKELVMINDALEKKYCIIVPAKLAQFRITIELHYFNRQQKRYITQKGLCCKTTQNKIPVYNGNQKIAFPHMDSLSGSLSLPEPDQYNSKQIVVPFQFPIGEYYVKDIKYNFFVPLLHIDFIYKLLY